MKKSATELVKEASRAHSDLNILYGVIALMESSLLTVDCQNVEMRIVRICKAEAQKCLARYDRATEQIAALASQRGTG